MGLVHFFISILCIMFVRYAITYMSISSINSRCWKSNNNTIKLFDNGVSWLIRGSHNKTFVPKALPEKERKYFSSSLTCTYICIKLRQQSVLHHFLVNFWYSGLSCGGKHRKLILSFSPEHTPFYHLQVYPPPLNTPMLIFIKYVLRPYLIICVVCCCFNFADLSTLHYLENKHQNSLLVESNRQSYFYTFCLKCI